MLEAKKAKAGYRAYDDEADLEAAALGLARPVLAKYDEHIDDGKAADKQKGFLIGDEDAFEAKKFKEMMVSNHLLIRYSCRHAVLVNSLSVRFCHNYQRAYQRENMVIPYQVPICSYTFFLCLFGLNKLYFII